MLYRYQLQSYAKLIGVLKVIVYALLLNGISSSTSIAQVRHSPLLTTPIFHAPIHHNHHWLASCLIDAIVLRV